MRKRDILKNHNHKIWLTKNGYYCTYVTIEGRRKLVRKREEKDILNAIDSAHKKNITFKFRFDVWVDRQRLCGISNNSIDRYYSDYHRFFVNSDFEKKPICEITEEDIYRHFKNVLIEKRIPYRALRTAFNYVKHTFEKSIRDKVIEKACNPCEYVDLKMLKTLCSDCSREYDRRTFTDEEIKALKVKINNPTNTNYNYVTNAAVEFAIYTGMRVGEISGLMWSDIDFEKGFINISHSEKHDRLTNTRFISKTKNNKSRLFPLTDDILSVIYRVKEYEAKNNYLGEFVFMDKNGRLKTGQISSSAYNKTGKSIHALRRTLNSKLKCNGVPTVIASSMLGHTEFVNEMNYTNDVTSLDYKKELLESIKTKM